VHSPLNWNVPGGHALHWGSELPSFDETVPRGHGWHASTPPLPPTSRYVSRGHGVHELDPAAAYHPRAHVEQFPARASENVPLGHVSHVAPSSDEAVPALHGSHVVFRPSTLDAVPTAHLVQSVSVSASHALHPGSRLYLPALHALQGPPCGPHHPGTHEQFIRSQALGLLNVPS
jgi:hypothetical protein